MTTPSQTAHPTEGEIDYTATSFADLQTVIGGLKPDFPNFADWSVSLPAGHWRAISAALSTQPSRPQGEEGLREAEKAATEANRDLRSALWQTLYPKFFLNKKALAEALDVMLPVFNAYATAQAVHAVFGRAALSNRGKPSS